MSKLEDSLSGLFGSDGLSRFFGGNGCGFELNGGLLIVIAIVFLLLATDLLDDIFCDDNIWIWIILIILLLFNFDDGCC